MGDIEAHTYNIGLPKKGGRNREIGIIYYIYIYNAS